MFTREKTVCLQTFYIVPTHCCSHPVIYRYTPYLNHSSWETCELLFPRQNNSQLSLEIYLYKTDLRLLLTNVWNLNEIERKNIYAKKWVKTYIMPKVNIISIYIRPEDNVRYRFNCLIRIRGSDLHKYVWNICKSLNLKTLKKKQSPLSIWEERLTLKCTGILCTFR